MKKQDAYSERARCVSGGRPSRATIESHTLISDDPEHPSTPECFRICLTLDFQHIERKEHDLADAD